MPITNQQRDQAYETANEQQRYLYANPESGLRLWAIAEKYSLTEDQTYTKFVILVGDVVLNLCNRTELPTLLSQTLGTSTEQAVKITGDLIDFLDHSQPATNTTETNDDLSSDIAETEAAISAVPAIRTMDQDMAKTQANEETTYSSTQEAIIKESQTKNQIPVPTKEGQTAIPVPVPVKEEQTTTPTPVPRWDSETN